MRGRSSRLAGLAALATTLAFVLGPIAAWRRRGATSDRDRDESRDDSPARRPKPCRRRRRDTGRTAAPVPRPSSTIADPRYDHARIASDVLDVIEDACAAGTSQTEALELGAEHLARSGWRYADARGFVFRLYEDL